MRNRFIGLIVVLITILAFSAVALAQAGQRAGTARTSTTSAKPFDPHDLSGIWVPTGPSVMSDDRPPMTDWGKAKWSTTKASGRKTPLAFGFFPEQRDWNDPIQWCDPAGYPRNLWYTGGGRGNLRIVQTPTEVLQFFERDHIWRDLWTDGRKLPDDPEPRWFGYSTAHWEGDTFVVESGHFDDRTWLDMDGSIHSDQMQLVERYRRADHDHLELVLTITDPKAYTAPWVSGKKIFNWEANSDRVQPSLWGKKADGTEYGDIREDLCLWSEQQSFYTRIDPTGDEGHLSIDNQK